MATTLFSYQEEGYRIDSGDIAVVTVHPEVRISVWRKDAGNFEDETVRVKLFVNVGNETIGIAENEYPSLEALMDVLGIDDIDEVWEILER